MAKDFEANISPLNVKTYSQEDLSSVGLINFSFKEVFGDFEFSNVSKHLSESVDEIDTSLPVSLHETQCEEVNRGNYSLNALLCHFNAMSSSYSKMSNNNAKRKIDYQNCISKKSCARTQSLKDLISFQNNETIGNDENIFSLESIPAPSTSKLGEIKDDKAFQSSEQGSENLKDIQWKYNNASTLCKKSKRNDSKLGRQKNSTPMNKKYSKKYSFSPNSVHINDEYSNFSPKIESTAQSSMNDSFDSITDYSDDVDLNVKKSSKVLSLVSPNCKNFEKMSTEELDYNHNMYFENKEAEGKESYNKETCFNNMKGLLGFEVDESIQKNILSPCGEKPWNFSFDEIITPYKCEENAQCYSSFIEGSLEESLKWLNNTEFKTGFIDSHCHIDFLFKRKNFQNNFTSYIDHCQETDPFPKSFEGCVTVFCNPSTFFKLNWWNEILATENVWGTFGCHPHFADKFTSTDEEFLYYALQLEKVKAAGEFGLDYSERNSVNKTIQKNVFVKQLNIAMKLKKPVVIHCRDAFEDCYEIMKKVLPKNYKIHKHCFTGDRKEANLWMDHFPNLYLGFTCLITHSSNRSTRVKEVVKTVSLNRILLETDAPYFRPYYLEGDKCSHPGMAIHVAWAIANLRHASMDEVLEATRRNTKELYDI